MRFIDFYVGNVVCFFFCVVLMMGKFFIRNIICGNMGSFNDDRWLCVVLIKDEIIFGEMF